MAKKNVTADLQEEALAPDTVPELVDVADADVPTPQATPNEYEVDTLAEVPDAPIVEPAAPAQQAMDAVDALDLGAVEDEAQPEPAAPEAPLDALDVLDDPAEAAPEEELTDYDEPAPPAEAPVEEQPVVAAAPQAASQVAAEAAPQPKEDTKMETVKEEIKQANPVAMPEPDYKARLMRKERNGYAGTFRLAEDETVLSMYRALKGKGVGGRVYLTNRRFLLEAALHTEMPIESVAGVSTGKYTQVKGVKLFFSLVFMAICAALVVVFTLPNLLGNWAVFEDMAWLRYVFYAVGGIFGFIGFLMFCTCFRKRFLFTVLSDGLQQTFSIRSSLKKTDVDVFQPITFGGPGRDYKRFCSEFGSRLAQIKQALRNQ